MHSDVQASNCETHPRERTHFKSMLLANQFAGLEVAAQDGPPAGDTSYEQLDCVGYHPQLKRIDAVVSIKRDSGYSGDICSTGSQEYVTFFASTDDGATWTDLGSSSFTAWDVAGVKPLKFDVSLAVDLREKCCRHENLVLIRALLSWQVPATNPAGPIVWGNGLDARVQVAARALGTFEHLFECLNLELDPHKFAEIVPIDQVIEFGAAKPMTPLQLHQQYEKSDVPPHRYLHKHATMAMNDTRLLIKAMSKSGSGVFSNLDIDLPSLFEKLFDPQGNQTYEQLGCVGLNQRTNELVATIDVKKPGGYSGNLCANGSKEYVAFWADWGSGYEYAGTTAVGVHDIASIPAGGLRYSAALPFAEALTRRRTCKAGPQVIRVRAVLSWETLPSDSNPFDVPHWGGHLEAHVLISPGVPVHGGPFIESIGGQTLNHIHDITGLAGVPGQDRPFGGWASVTGGVVNAGGTLGGPGIAYRVMVAATLGATPAPLTAPFTVTLTDLLTLVQTDIVQTPDGDGWCPYLADSSTMVFRQYLGGLETTGEGKLWFSVEARQFGVPIGATGQTVIQLDNERPDVSIDITSGGGSCGDFAPGDSIVGSYTASDNDGLSSVSIGLVNAMTGAVMTQSPTPDMLIESESGTWTLTTSPTSEPCGYVVQAIAVDRAFVNDSTTSNWSADQVGFCLRKP